MSRKERYFVKQKLMGLALMILAIMWSFICDAVIFGIVGVPIGLWLLFTKEMVIVDDYSDEMNERRRRRS